MSENMALGLIYELDKINHESIISKVKKYFNEDSIKEYIKLLNNHENYKKRVRSIKTVLEGSAKDVISETELFRLREELNGLSNLIKKYDDNDNSLFKWLNIDQNYDYKSDIQRIIAIAEAILLENESDIYSLTNYGRWRFSTVIRVMSYFIPIKFTILNDDDFNQMNVTIVKDGGFKLEDSIYLDLTFSTRLQSLIDSVK